MLRLEGLEEVLVRVARDAARLALEEHGQGSKWLDVEGAADHLATSPDAVYALVKRRQVPVHRTPSGRRLLFDRRELDEWVREAA